MSAPEEPVASEGQLELEAPTAEAPEAIAPAIAPAVEPGPVAPKRPPLARFEVRQANGGTFLVHELPDGRHALTAPDGGRTLLRGVASFDVVARDAADAVGLVAAGTGVRSRLVAREVLVDGRPAPVTGLERSAPPFFFPGPRDGRS